MPTIPNLPSASAITGAELVVVEQNGETRKTTANSLLGPVSQVGVTGPLTASGYDTVSQNGLLGLSVVETSAAFSTVNQALAAEVPPGESLTVFYIATGNGAGARLSLQRPGTGAVITTQPPTILRNGQIERVVLPNNHATLAGTSIQLDSNGVSDTQIVRVVVPGTMTETTPEIAALLNSVVALMEMARASNEALRQRSLQIENAVSLIDERPNAIPQAAHDFEASPFTTLTECAVAAGPDGHGGQSWIITKTTSGTARARIRLPLSALGLPSRVSTAFRVAQADYDAAGTVIGTVYQRNLAGAEISANIRYGLSIVQAGETITPAAPRAFHDAGRLMDVATEQVELEITITGSSGRKVYVRNLLVAPGSNAAFRLPPPEFTTDELIAAALVAPTARIAELETGQALTQRAIMADDKQAVPPGLGWEHTTPYFFRNQSGQVETLFDRSAARALITDVAWNGVEVFVSPTGNDANDGLSASQAKRSIHAAITVANGHAEAGAVVRVKGAGGRYMYSHSISGAGGVAPTKPMAFVNDDGVRITHVAGDDVAVWPSAFDATYTACVRFNQNSVHNIIATHIVDDYILAKAVQLSNDDMAGVQALPGSWCTNTSAGDSDIRIYYHPLDGVLPNRETTIITRSRLTVNLNACVTDLYFEGFDIFGGMTNGDGSLNVSAGFDLDAIAYDRTASLYDMGVYYPGSPSYSTMDCYGGRGSKLISWARCIGVGAPKDVFNGHVRGAGAEPQGYMEIGNIGRLSGLHNASSNQLSTLHGHAKGITALCDYRQANVGEIITDIENARRWIIGGEFEAVAAGGSPPVGIKGANTSGVASLWVQDATITTPAGGRTLAAEPAKVRKKRVTSVGGAEYVFGGGAEIIDDTANAGWTA